MPAYVHMSHADLVEELIKRDSNAPRTLTDQVVYNEQVATTIRKAGELGLQVSGHVDPLAAQQAQQGQRVNPLHPGQPGYNPNFATEQNPVPAFTTQNTPSPYPQPLQPGIPLVGGPIGNPANVPAGLANPTTLQPSGSTSGVNKPNLNPNPNPNPNTTPPINPATSGPSPNPGALPVPVNVPNPIPVAHPKV